MATEILILIACGIVFLCLIGYVLKRCNIDFFDAAVLGEVLGEIICGILGSLGD